MPRQIKGAPGFQKLKDAHIVSVNNRACNVVTIKTAQGDVFEIEADVTSIGIPVLQLTKKEKKRA
jgi:hypothetical protein